MNKQVLMYVHDILAISCDPQSILTEVQGQFEFKSDKIEEPKFYLGAKLRRKPLNGHKCWNISSVDYVNATVKNVEQKLQQSGRKLLSSSHMDRPMNMTYSPESDVMVEFDEDDVT